MKNTAEQILEAIAAGFAAGGKDEWDAPEFQAARELTGAAGCQWDFMGWRDTAATIRAHGKLGGAVLNPETNESDECARCGAVPWYTRPASRLSR